jgi:light-regulated signal transduction histidine kinase (bacteriophytochrome)
VLNEDARASLARTRAAAQRMGRLIDDLLKLARMSRIPMAFTSVDLSALARDIAARCAQSEPQRDVEFRIANNVRARGDAGLLGIVLENLLGNAWKYTSRTAGATIEFGAARTRDDETYYYVRDNGAGFDMMYVDKLFRPFQRLHGAEFPGTGIGLATVARIVGRHGGRVWAEGEPGKGATFAFTLRGETA